MIDPATAGACAGCKHWGTVLASNRRVKHTWAICKKRHEWLVEHEADEKDDLTRDDDTCLEYAPRDLIERMDPKRFGARRARRRER